MRAMLEEMTASEFSGWMAYASIEPWGFVEENRRVGVLASMFANFGPRELRRTVQPEEFIPRVQQRSPSVIEKIKAAFGYGKE